MAESLDTIFMYLAVALLFVENQAKVAVDAAISVLRATKHVKKASILIRFNLFERQSIMPLSFLYGATGYPRWIL